MSFRTIGQTKSMLLAACATLAICPAIVHAEAPAQVRLDIASQDLGTALTELAAKSNREIYFSADLTRGKRSKSLNGRLTVDQALNTLLANTGLKYRLNEDGSIVIEGNAGAGGGPAETASSSGEDARSEKGIAEILVVGQKTLNVDIRRTENDPQPYVVFDSKQIEKSGATNLEDFFRKYLPMNTAQQPRSQSALNGANGKGQSTSQINLRGLGVDQTLILIDGRRAPRLVESSGTPAGAFTQADINGIPLAQIDRVEILPSTAGGIYGGGATGGVINIILKSDYNGLNVRAGYDGTFRGGAESYNLSVSGGISGWSGRTQLNFSAAVKKTQPLYAKDNDLLERSRRLLVANDPQSESFIFFPGSTANVKSYFGDELILKPEFGGVSLGSNHTYIPNGYAGAASDGGAGLVANAGQYNLKLSPDAVGQYLPLSIGLTSKSLSASLKQKIGDRVQAFVDGNLFVNDSVVYGYAPNPVFLNPDAPTNPFQNYVYVAAPADGRTKPTKAVSRTLSLRGGLIAKLWKDWSATVEYDHNRSESKSHFVTSAINAQGESDLAGGAVNLFVDEPIHLSDYPFEKLSRSSFTSIESDAALRFGGTLARLPGGPLALSGLLEYRQSVAPQSITFLQYTTGSFGTVSPRKSQDVQSAYVELRAPLVSSENNLPAVESLELQASLRHDHYKTKFTEPGYYFASEGAEAPTLVDDTARLSSTNYTLALKWNPIKDLAIRGSYATGFVPPGIGILAPNAPVTYNFPVGPLDPLRNNEPLGIFAPVTFISGGSPDLRPEHSKSFSAGVVIEPRFVPGLRVSADYTRINKSDEITQLFDQLVIENPDLFPGLVVRAPLTPEQQALGYTVGPVTTLRSGFFNVASTRVRAWDLKLDYNVDTHALGSLHFYSVMTYQPKFVRRIISDLPTYNTVGFIDGPLKWRGNAGIDWVKGSWTLGWNAQFYNAYRITYATPGLAASNDLIVQRQGTARIPSQIYNDISLQYIVAGPERSLLKGLQITAGILNVFDKKPPVLAEGLYSTYGDPRLRRFYFSVTKHIGH